MAGIEELSAQGWLRSSTLILTDWYKSDFTHASIPRRFERPVRVIAVSRGSALGRARTSGTVLKALPAKRRGADALPVGASGVRPPPPASGGCWPPKLHTHRALPYQVTYQGAMTFHGIFPCCSLDDAITTTEVSVGKDLQVRRSGSDSLTLVLEHVAIQVSLRHPQPPSRSTPTRPDTAAPPAGTGSRSSVSRETTESSRKAMARSGFAASGSSAHRDGSTGMRGCTAMSASHAGREVVQVAGAGRRVHADR